MNRLLYNPLLARELRRVRKARHLSLEQAARLTGLKEHELRRAEQGYLPASAAKRKRLLKFLLASK